MIVHINRLDKIVYIVVFTAVTLFAQDGIDYYYGLGVEKNYQKAIDVFKKDGSETATQFIIIMYLNGDGVPKNPKKALELWNKAAAQSQIADMSMYELKTIIDERLANPDKTFAPVEYCDIAMTTYDMNYCAGIESRIEDQNNKRINVQVIKEFTPLQKEVFDSIQSNFKVIAKNDADRMYTLYSDGSIRNAAFTGMESYLTGRHQKRIGQFIAKKKNAVYKEPDFLKADQDLNAAYKEQRSHYKKSFDELIAANNDSPESKTQYQENYMNVNANLKNAQVAWIKYRDNWVKLMKTIFPADSAIDISVKTILTKERAEELQYNSVE